RPRFSSPGLPLHDGDEIDEPPPGDEVMHEVAAGAHPVARCHLEPEMREPFRRDQAAVGDATGKARSLRTEQRAAYGRMDAVGADQHAGRDPRAVREPQFDAITIVGEPGDAVPEMHAIRG